MIPIQNLYYLLLYAWDALEQSDDEVVGGDPETQVLDLLASVLNEGVDRLLRQGLHRNYHSKYEPIHGVRGKLDLATTVKTDLLRQARTFCEYDELTHDILHNQIIKASIYRLLRTAGLDQQLRESLRVTWHRLHDVSLIPLTDCIFRRIQLHRNNRLYRFLIDVCHILHSCLIPIKREGLYTFRNFLRDERRMRVLFERFVRNFFQRHADDFKVESELLQWEDTAGSDHDKALLPRMRTDVTLRSQNTVLVIDAKYYIETLQLYRGKATVRSAHLYQIYAYLQNVAKTVDPNTGVEGLIIYPLTKYPLNLDYLIHGHRVRINTLNLRQSWSNIHADLLALLPGRSAKTSDKCG